MPEIRRRVQVKRVEVHSKSFLEMTMTFVDIVASDFTLFATPEEVYSLGKLFNPEKILTLIIQD